jgi:hypothetical protein
MSLEEKMAKKIDEMVNDYSYGEDKHSVAKEIMKIINNHQIIKEEVRYYISDCDCSWCTEHRKTSGEVRHYVTREQE